MNKPSTLSLECTNLNWKIKSKPILRDINLTLRPNEVLGIIGPNGAGKSSLLKVLAGVIKPDSGSLKLQGDYYHNVKTRRFSELVGYLEQNSSVHWPLQVRKVIELGRIPYQGFSQKLSDEDQQAIEAAIAATGIAPLLNRVITTLSEGERMLVAICRILSTQSQIILADEPVAALDPYHQLLILELLQGLAQQQKNFSVVVVLHDLSLAARFCDRLLLLHQGSIVSSGAIEQVLTPAILGRYYKVHTDIDYHKQVVLPLSRIT